MNKREVAMARKKKGKARPTEPAPKGIPDTLENVIKALVKPLAPKK